MLAHPPSDPVQANRNTSPSGIGSSLRRGARPNFFIVGAPKCGTTAMSDYLGAHPDIFMARKEMHFFGADLRFAQHFYRRTELEYLAEFAGWKGQAQAGEASVWYLFSERAAAEIHAFSPDAKIIIMLREPVSMMYSLYCYFRYDGNEPLPSFEAALAAEPERRAGGGQGRQTYFAQGLVYRDAARYAHQVRRYYEVFGRERVHVVLFDDLAAHPATVYRSILEFLAVDAMRPLPQFERVNEAKSVKNRTVQSLLNAPTLRSTILAVRPLLPNFVFSGLDRIRAKIQGMNSSTERPQPLDPELKARLRLEFAPEVTELSTLIGRDLGRWSASTP